MKTKEQIQKQTERLKDMALMYYLNDVPRRRKFMRLINLLGARWLWPNAFKHPETTWQSCWDYAFKES